MISDNLNEFAGRPVRDWSADEPISDPKAFAYRVRLSYDEEDSTGLTWSDKFGEFLQDPKVGQVEAFIVGTWSPMDSGGTSAELVEAISAARDKLNSLRHFFIGDIISEENEISWIMQSDLSPIFEAYPNLETLGIRGGSELSLGSPRHDKLRKLVIESGGLGREVVHEVCAAKLPALEHLELWLGDGGYGATSTVEDLAPLLKGDLFPKLKYLGLRNAEITDDIAAALALAPITARLEVLDLSFGTLGDDGARALLASPAVRKLKKLDVHHHFISKEVVTALQKLGIEVDASDEQEPHTGGGESTRFVSVSE